MLNQSTQIKETWLLFAVPRGGPMGPRLKAKNTGVLI